MNLVDKIRTYFITRNNNNSNNDNPFDFFSLIDQGLVASWDAKTGINIKRMMDASRMGLLPDQEVFGFLTMLDDVTARKYNDQTIDSHKYDGYIPLQGAYKYDKVTTYGLSLFCALIIQKSSAIPATHMAAGDGVGATQDYDDILVSEQIRYKFADNGYINNLNKVIRFHMIFDILEPTFTVKEIGMFNVATANTGPMISRTTFDPGIVHEYGENFFTSSYLIITLSS
ncbi:MAG: hypothetical protein L0H53_00780 [Candidatus Nitrosocosmicus sp.]|nr:hypothetical protein [Candidatus Nitrosocosmicus sp.]